MRKIAVLSLLVVYLEVLAPAAVPPKMAESVDGNTLTMTLLSEPATLDIHRIFAVAYERILADLGATLIAADPETGEPVPYLATQWAVSEDGLLWTFHLRDDVWFHDGTPFTAEEYVWTINRILSLTYPESFVPKALLSSVTGAKAVDPYTLELQLRSPDATLLSNLESSFLQPLSPQAVESAGEDYGRQPVGVGPFRFKEWVPGQKIVVERNPDFTWGPAFTSGGPAQIDQIEYAIIPNYDLAFVSLLEGQIDVLEVEPADARRVLDSERLTLTSVTVAGGPFYLALNVTKPPLNDIRVRQALNHAVDREQLVSVIEYGYGEVLYGLVSPTTIGAWPGAEEIGYHYDPSRARTLLAEAGYELNDQGLLVKDGALFSLTVVTPLYASTTQFPRIMDILSDQFRQVGIKVEVVTVEANNLLAAVADSTAFDAVLNGVEWPEATFILLNIILSSGQFNVGHVNDPELDQLLTASFTSTDLEAGRQLLWNAQKRIIENAYFVPIYAPSNLYAVNNRVKGFSELGNVRWLIDTSIE